MNESDRTQHALVLTRPPLAPSDALANAVRRIAPVVHHLPLRGDAAALRTALEAHVDRVGPPAVFINVLERASAFQAVERVRDAEWLDAVDLDLTATLVACQVLGGAMLSAGRGVIVTVLAGRHDDAVAGITDQAAVGLMRVLGVEWAPRGVRVVTVAPDGASSAERDAEVAATVEFLAGPEAGYVTATELRVQAA